MSIYGFGNCFRIDIRKSQCYSFNRTKSERDTSFRKKPDKIFWFMLSQNPSIFELDYKALTDNYGRIG